MPLTDLPPWLSGQQDRGFLAGAQLGITAARTGTDIAATRQQMSQSGELQPFRVAAADIANRINRQQLDLGAALFPLKIQQAELQNQQAATQIVGQATGNQLQMMELENTQADAVALTPWLAKVNDPEWMLANPPAVRSKWGQSVITAQRESIAKTKWGQAESKAFETLSQRADEVSKYDPASFLKAQRAIKDGRPDLAAEILGVAQETIRQKIEQEQISKTRKLGEVSNEFRIQLEQAKQSGRLELVQQQLDKRAGDVVNQSKDVNRRKVFEAALKVARDRGDFEEQDRLIAEFRSELGGGEPAAAPAAIDRLLSETEQEYQQAFVAGDDKKAKAAKEKLVRAKVLQLRSQGKVFNPDDQASWKNLKEGELVVFPPNLNSTRAEERVEHVRVFNEKTLKEVLGKRAKLLEDAIRSDEKSKGRAKDRKSNLEELSKTYTGQF